MSDVRRFLGELLGLRASTPKPPIVTFGSMRRDVACVGMVKSLGYAASGEWEPLGEICSNGKPIAVLFVRKQSHVCVSCRAKGKYAG